MTWAEVVALARRLPGVEQATSYGTPGLRAGGKFLTRLRDEDASLVIMGVGFDEREHLIEAAPEVFHLTPHYQAHPAVLARMAAIAPEELAGLLERRWRAVSRTRDVAAYDAARTAE